MRHTVGTRLAEAGVDVFTIKNSLGHASPQTSAIYVHATNEGERRAVESLPSWFRSPRVSSLVLLSRRN
ncbi:MAG: tyrosine-type recombinase/integrase [Blastocatellia bacterium]|nr:tyrosine-type recombinase/integrase [Blastocatellia bacterium]